jgi:hypothetical protein
MFGHLLLAQREHPIKKKLKQLAPDSKHISSYQSSSTLCEIRLFKKIDSGLVPVGMPVEITSLITRYAENPFIKLIKTLRKIGCEYLVNNVQGHQNDYKLYDKKNSNFNFFNNNSLALIYDNLNAADKLAYIGTKISKYDALSIQESYLVQDLKEVFLYVKSNQLTLSIKHALVNYDLFNDMLNKTHQTPGDIWEILTSLSNNITNQLRL